MLLWQIEAFDILTCLLFIYLNTNTTQNIEMI